MAAAPKTTEDVLRLVHALHARAAKTTFPAEAELCRKRAQRLMAQHSISETLLADGDPSRAGTPDNFTITFDGGYTKYKATLLNVSSNPTKPSPGLRTSSPKSTCGSSAVPPMPSGPTANSSRKLPP